MSATSKSKTGISRTGQYLQIRTNTGHARTPYKFTAPPKEIFEWAKLNNVPIAAGHHDFNPYLKKHHFPAYLKPLCWIMLPLTILVGIRAQWIEYQHNKHVEDIRPEYREIEYLRILRTPFPWGDGKHTLFHNPKRNPVPGVGYEA